MNYLEDLNYARDPRVRAKDRLAGIKAVDANRLRAVLSFHLEGSELEMEVGIRFEVCSICSGTGSHVNPSIDASGISREEFDEDPSFMEDYLSGFYNVSCYGCNGERVVPVPVGFNREEQEFVKKWESYVIQEMRYRAEDAVAWAMGY